MENKIVPPLSKQPKTSAIIVISGPPCSGKSTIAQMIRKIPNLEGFRYFVMDEIRLTMRPGSHTPQDRNWAYGHMHELASQALQAGAPGVILDATYQPAEQRRAIRVMADGHGAKLYIFECYVKPNEAVLRFQERSNTHAATDLSAEKVWDLAHDFPYIPQSSKHIAEFGILNSTKDSDVIKIVGRQLNIPISLDGLREWVDCGKYSRHQIVIPQSTTPQTPNKLTARSRNISKREIWRRKWGITISSAFILIAGSILIKKCITSIFDVPRFEDWGFEGDPTTWITIWLTCSGLIYAMVALKDQLLQTPRVVSLKAIIDAGKVPQFQFTETSPLNIEVYNRYKRRIIRSNIDQLLIPEVPIWFAIQRSQGFDVVLSDNGIRPIDTNLLEKRAASVGLDWYGYRKWREKEKLDQYFDRYQEDGIRVLDLRTINNNVNLNVCKGSLVSYLCTELSANICVEGRYGYELRQVFEGEGWIQSSNESGEKSLDLNDISGASKTYEMLLGVQVALTTEDGYLVLQRRSDLVQAGGGNLGASGAGSAKLDDIKSNNGLLTESALREIREEIGWIPHAKDDLCTPFLGAGFSLQKGRDLNFYCHFHTHWTLKQIIEGHNNGPTGVNNARDAWEVAHIVLIPISDIQKEGKLSPRFQKLIGESRHLQGLIYCLANSDKFKEIQQQIKDSAKS